MRTADQFLMNILASTSLLGMGKNDEESDAIVEMITEIIDCTVRSCPEGDVDAEELFGKMIGRLKLIMAEHGYDGQTVNKVAEEAEAAMDAEAEIMDEEPDEDGADPEPTEFELKYEKLLKKLKTADKEFYGYVIMNHFCIQDEELYPEDEALEIVRDFIVCASGKLPASDYGADILALRQCFTEVMNRHHYPEEKMPEALEEIIRLYLNATIEAFETTYEEEANSGLYDPEEIRQPGSNDLDTVELARLFADIPYQKEDEDFCREIEVDYDYEHHHMTNWFSCHITLGKGHYSRRIPDFSARSTYNHLTNPNSFLWIATVMGVPHDLIRKAYSDMKVGKTYSGMCGVIRKLIPFDMILDLAIPMLEGDEEE